MKGESAVFNISTGEVVMGDAWAKLTGEGVKGYLYVSGSGDSTSPSSEGVVSMRSDAGFTSLSLLSDAQTSC
jgi:hypothetical protein